MAKSLGSSLILILVRIIEIHQVILWNMPLSYFCYFLRKRGEFLLKMRLVFYRNIRSKRVAFLAITSLLILKLLLYNSLIIKVSILGIQRLSKERKLVVSCTRNKGRNRMYSIYFPIRKIKCISRFLSNWSFQLSPKRIYVIIKGLIRKKNLLKMFSIFRSLKLN